MYVKQSFNFNGNLFYINKERILHIEKSLFFKKDFNNYLNNVKTFTDSSSTNIKKKLIKVIHLNLQFVQKNIRKYLKLSNNFFYLFKL